MAAVEVEGLRKTYGDVVAVDRIDLEIAEGEVLAILGPNGAGKTTTVEILEGYRTPDAGTVRVLGVDPRTGGQAWRERIGIVLQEAGFEELFTPRELIRLHAGWYPHPRAVDEVIEMVGLQDKADARVRALSGGQRRRLDLALGIVGSPELLFLDEPTTGFDPSARATRVGAGRPAAGHRRDDPADHALPGRGPAPGRPARGRRPRAGGRAGHRGAARCVRGHGCGDLLPAAGRHRGGGPARPR